LSISHIVRGINRQVFIKSPISLRMQLRVFALKRK